MSVRAANRSLEWITKVAGQFAAVAAVPAAIVLALAMKPQPTTEKRTDPLWHNTGHTRTCPACRLLSQQSRSLPSGVEPELSDHENAAPKPPRIAAESGTDPETTAEVAISFGQPVTML